MAQTIEVLALPESIARLAAFTDALERSLPLSFEQGYLMRLAIEEISSNIIKYSYPPGQPGPIRVDCSCDDRQLCVIISDRGQPFDPHAAPPPDLTSDLGTRTVGGLGLYLVRELSDTLTYWHDVATGWNELVVLKGAEASDV